jgi:hypothetical protein
MTGLLLLGLVAIGLAHLWQMHRLRKAQIEQGLKFDFLTGLMDGRTIKLSQDVAHVRELLLEETKR